MEAKHENHKRLLGLCESLPPTPTAAVHPWDQGSLKGPFEAAGLEFSTILLAPQPRIVAVTKPFGVGRVPVTLTSRAAR